MVSAALSTDAPGISASTTPKRQETRSHTTIIVCSIIGALLLVFLGLGALLYHCRCRRSRRSTRTRSSSIESFVAGYSTYSTEGSHCEYQEIPNPASYYPVAVLPPVPSLIRSTGSRPESPSALSFLTIPGSLYVSDHCTIQQLMQKNSPHCRNPQLRTRIHQQHPHPMCILLFWDLA